MPQGRRPTAEEVLGLPPRRPTAEEVLGLPPQRPTAEQVLGLPQQPQEDLPTRIKNALSVGYQQGKQALGGAVDAISEAGAAASRGDFRPFLELLEGTARGGINSQLAVLTGGASLGAAPTIARSQAEPIARLNAEREARQLAGPDATYYRNVAAERARLEAEAAKDPSLAGRLTRGVTSGGVQMLPAIVVGAATGGSVPAIAAVSALSALGQPENATFAGVASALPLPSARAIKSAISPVVEKLLGRGAAQIVEAEAAQAGGALLRTGAVANQEAIRAASLPSAGLNAAIAEAAKEVPQSTTRRILGEVASFPRAMMSSLDISAPGRQGLLLAASPTRWGAAIRAGGRMFQAFKSSRYDKITKEIANHADAAVADDAGLYLAFKQSEEFFTSKLANKIPGVGGSQRAYETYLDSLRMDVFSKYKKVIDAQNLSAEQAKQAYAAAAKWINVASGRGSFGKKFDDAVPFLSNFLFAPRYMASRFQVLNPIMYARNYANPVTRGVAKQQMKDLVGYLSLVATTYGMAKAAGADVNLSPSSRDFLKIRVGNKTFDGGAGLVQVMRFAINASRDLYRASKGEKAEAFKDAGSLTLNFIRSKTAPLPSYVWDFFSRRTYTGQPFTSAKDRAVGALERVVPLTWSDFAEALYNEGIGSAAATLPGALGIGVQSYATQPGGFIEQAAPLLREYTRANRQLPEIRRIKGEGDQQFNARLKVFGEALSTYGQKLVESDEYRQASVADRDRALDLLPRRIGSALIKQGESWQLEPRVLMSDVKDSQEMRRLLEQERGR